MQRLHIDSELAYSTYLGGDESQGYLSKTDADADVDVWSTLTPSCQR